MKFINDTYALKARVYPMIIFFLPLLLLTVSYSIQFKDYAQLLTSVGIVGALSFLFSQIGRDSGKKKEANLWKSWGGPPTCQILRFRNNRIDKITKARIHEMLMTKCPPGIAVSQQIEGANPEEMDGVYQAWTRFLISKTRDTTKFSLLFKENMNYGFRRNLWGLKPYSITLLIILSFVSYLYYYGMTYSYNVSFFPYVFFVSQGIIICFLMFWIFKVNSNWVRLAADAYAERLIEATNEI